MEDIVSFNLDKLYCRHPGESRDPGATDTSIFVLRSLSAARWIPCQARMTSEGAAKALPKCILTSGFRFPDHPGA